MDAQLGRLYKDALAASSGIQSLISLGNQSVLATRNPTSSFLSLTLRQSRQAARSNPSLESQNDLRRLLEQDVNDPYVDYVNWGLQFVNQHPELYDHKPLASILANFTARAAEARSHFNWYPNVIAIGPAGQLWSMRNIIFYGLSIVLWLSYFYAFLRLGRSNAPLRDRNPGEAI